jgi:serine/threonine-protein kinase
MKASQDPFLGLVLQGCTLERVLGRGPLTTVYAASTGTKHPPLLATFLRVPTRFSSQEHWRFRERFWQLAQRIERLHHPGLLPLVGYGERNGLCYLLTPDLSGSTLFPSHRPIQRGSPRQALSMLAPLTEIITYLHAQGLTCRFFQPTNILLPKGAEQANNTLQLTGYGLTQMLCRQGVLEENSHTSNYPHLQSINGDYLGTAAYLAPEVIKGRIGDGRADVYALGVLLFTFLTGRVPFPAKSYLESIQKQVREPLPTLHTLLPTLPLALELVINQALHRDPERRFQTPRALLSAYQRVLDERMEEETTLQALQAVRKVQGMSVSGNRELPTHVSSGPTSEPLSALTTTYLDKHIEQIRTQRVVTTPLSQGGHGPEPVTQKLETMTIEQMIQDIRKQRALLQASQEKQNPAPGEEVPRIRPERFPGWLN